jgi:Ser/Thr protein kinase RdoA (MazF antagonist)
MQAARRLEAVVAEFPDLLTTEELNFARDRTREIAMLPPWPRVPCHGDYKPTNWLVDAAGVLRVVDFGLARWHVPAFDLTRLCLGPWWGRPQLASAFLEGYGRALTEEEEQYLKLILVSHAVIAIRYGKAQRFSDREEFGRTRLSELMSGKTVAFTESRHRASIRRLRSVGGAARRRLTRPEQQAASLGHPQ